MLEAAALCLALNIYHEARDQSIQGQAMTAYVVLNRVDDRRWPDNICDVVHQKHQFSWYWDGASDKPQEPEAWAIAQTLAKDILSHGERSTAAVYYHTTGVSPSWALRVNFIQQVGDHRFYN